MKTAASLRGAFYKLQAGTAAVELAIIISATTVLMPAVALFAKVFFQYSVIKETTPDAATYMASMPVAAIKDETERDRAIAIAERMVEEAGIGAGLSGSTSVTSVAAVEFALGAMLFFTFVFGVIELARALYMWSTMIEGTRRAARGASMADFSAPGVLAAVRARAMFAELPGGLPLRGKRTEDNLSIDYLNGRLERVSPVPACPEQNIINCNTDPDGASCIRFARVRLCVESGAADCTKVDYGPIISANFSPGAPLKYPTFATVTPVATLGRQPGAAGQCM